MLHLNQDRTIVDKTTVWNNAEETQEFIRRFENEIYTLSGHNTFASFISLI